MTEEARQIIRSIRHFEDAYRYSINGEVLDMSCGDFEKLMTDAADLIEQLSADLESNERQARENFGVSSQAIAKVEAKCDALKRRCEAAERDIRSMLRGNGSCMYCGKFGTDGCSWKDCWNAVEWRGPCKENGGVDDGRCQVYPIRDDGFCHYGERKEVRKT